jgi:hypothetical protein
VPDYVLKNKTKGVGPYVLSLPEGTSDVERDAAVDLMADGGWSLDAKADPADVLPPEQPAVPATATPKEQK